MNSATFAATMKNISYVYPFSERYQQLDDFHFNSHAHEGRDPVTRFRHLPADYISTHTPTRGVTELFKVCLNRRMAISTHTPTRGVTRPAVVV